MLYILAGAIVFQLASAIMAFRLIRLTEKYAAWSLVSLALALMAMRRIIPLYHLINNDLLITLDPVNETIGLILSFIMMLGIIKIAPLFIAIKKSQKELEKREALLQRTFDQSPLGKAIVSLDSRFIRVNESLCRMLGYSDKELLALTFMDITHPQYLEQDKKQVRDLADGKIEQYVADKQYLTKDGSIIWVHISVGTIKDNAGVPIYFLLIIEDITERHQAKELLQKSEEKYRILVDNAAEAILVAQDGLLKFVNHKLMELTGYSERELLTKPYLDFIHPDDHNMVIENHEKRMKGEQVLTEYTFRILTIDGIAKWMKIHPLIIEWEGKPATLNLLTDITEHKRSEETLRKNEKDLKEAQRVGRFGSWDWDIATDVITWSEEYYRLYGLDPTQRPPGYVEHLKAYTNESAARLDAAVKKSMQTGEPYEIDLELANPKESCCWVTARNEIKRDAQGKIIGLRGTAQDITERKLTEEALRQSEEKFRALVESAKDGILLLSSRGQIVTLNSAFAKMHGYSIEEMLTMNLKDLDAPESAQLAPARIQRTLAGESMTFEVKHYCKNKRTIPLEVSINLVILNNEKFILGFHRDITERKRAEQALQLSCTRLEEAEKTAEIGNWEANLISNELYWSETIFDIFGFDSKSFKPSVTAFYEAVHPDDRKIVLESEKRSEQTGLHDVVHRIIRPNGEVRFVHELAKRYADDKGNLIMLRGTVQDITEREKAEKHIQLLGQIADEAPASITIHDFDGNFFYANEETFRLHGYTRQEFLTKNLSDIDVPETAELIAKRMQLIRDKGEADFDVHHFRKDGIQIPLHVNVKIIDWHGQKALLSIATDITEREKAETLIKHNSEFLESLLQSLSHPFYVIDANNYMIIKGNLAAQNQGAQQNITCYSATHKRNTPCEDSNHPCPLNIVKQTKKTVIVEHIHYDTNNKPVFIEIHGYPILDSAGNVIQMIEYTHDITERKNAEKALRMQAELLDNSIDAILLHDEKGRFLYSNNAAYKTLGYSKEEFTNMTLAEIDMPESANLIESRIKELSKKRQAQFVVSHRCKDGSQIPVEVHVSIINLDGKEYFLAVWRDITERKQIEKEKEKLQIQLVQSEKMAGIGTLAAGIAHEFNNFLQIISGYAELAQKAKSKIPPDMNKAINQISDASNKASDIVKNLLKFTKPSSSILQKCLATELIDAVLSLTETQFAKNFSITITKNYLDQPVILANKSEIQQLFMELIINARDAMKAKGGRITITVKQTGNYAEMDFADTGAGIEKDNLKKIFEPFFTTKGPLGGSETPGTGLGLSICYGIATRHGGTIEAESQYGHGATFIVRLPITPKIASKSPNGAQEQ